MEDLWRKGERTDGRNDTANIIAWISRVAMQGKTTDDLMISFCNQSIDRYLVERYSLLDSSFVSSEGSWLDGLVAAL